MAQTFDIRFARTAGLAALLEVPENRFRWKGGGLLKIDPHGISIGVKRGLHALAGGKHTQRIPSENLRAVYREGEALRVEYQDTGTARNVLPFWADNRETAAQIVKLLPTRQTVEIEHSIARVEPRTDWRMLMSAGVALAVILAGAWAWYGRTQQPVSGASLATPGGTSVTVESPISLPMPDATASLTPGSHADEGAPLADAPMPKMDAPAFESPTTPDFIEPPVVMLPPLPPLPLPRDYVRSQDFVIPIPRGTAAYSVAKLELTIFERETSRLEADYRLQRDLLDGTAITTEEFAQSLEELEMRWWGLTFQIFDNDGLAKPELLSVRATMLAAARLWRVFLTTYAKGLRERNHVMIASAFDELARAQEMQSRALLYLR